MPASIENLVEGIPNGIAGGITVRHLADDAETDKAGIRGHRAFEFPDAVLADLGVEGQPVAEDHVAVLPRDIETVVVDLPNLVEVVHPGGQGKVEDRPHVVPAEGIRHFPLGLKFGGGAPDPFLAGALDRILEDVTALGAPVRMAVENPHDSPLLASRGVA